MLILVKDSSGIAEESYPPNQIYVELEYDQSNVSCLHSRMQHVVDRFRPRRG
jgi:hypothetical protein